MPDSLDKRIDSPEENERRAWAAIESLADKQEKLDDLVVQVLEAQAAADQRAERRGRAVDERIDKLVSAIGELIRTRGGL